MEKIRKHNQRKVRTRAKVVATGRARLSVHKTNKYVYAQVIDDNKGVTLAAARGTKPAEVGKDLAKKALAKKVKEVVFDRGGFKYHGKIKALADAAREGGLNF